MAEQKLTENFLIELFKASISSKNVLEVVSQHLELHFLPRDEYKTIWKVIKSSFELTNICPTIGHISEQVKDDQKSLDLLRNIKKCKLPEVENIFPTFEKFIKEVRFISLYQEVGKLWNKGDQDEAIEQLAGESEKINTFSLKEGLYAKVFLDFEKRQDVRKNSSHDEIVKIPFGIHGIDYYSHGGINIGTSALFVSRSGLGKSTLLRWVGINTARAGLKVVHFQVESTEKEIMEAYDAAWCGQDLRSIEFGGISKKNELKVKNINQEIINKGGEIFVIAPSQFDSLSIESCRESIEEIEKNYGKVSLCLFDNVELFSTNKNFSNSELGERLRREDIVNKITNMAVMFKLACVVTAQSNDVPPAIFNNPDFVLTRSNIAEFKGLVKPFSFFATINQTDDEYEAEICRIYIDKMRKYRSYKTVTIYQSLNNSRFYDSARTLNEFWDVHKNCPL